MTRVDKYYDKNGSVLSILEFRGGQKTEMENALPNEYAIKFKCTDHFVEVVGSNVVYHWIPDGIFSEVI